MYIYIYLFIHCCICMIVFILPTLHSFSRRCVCLVILPICGGHGPWKLLVDSNIWCPNLLDTLPKNIQKLDFQLVSIYPCWSKKVNLVLSIKPVDLGPYYSATCGRIKSFEFPTGSVALALALKHCIWRTIDSNFIVKPWLTVDFV